MELTQSEDMAADIGDRDESGKARQVAALPWRKRDGTVEYLLITSLYTGRWIVPKGWPQKGKSRRQSAQAEAWEEAGIVGPASKAIGSFDYRKIQCDGGAIPCSVDVFPLHVRQVRENFPERGARKRAWIDRVEAARLVDEPQLSELMMRFSPGM